MKGYRGRGGECLEKEVIDPHLVYHELETSLLVIYVCAWESVCAGFDLCCLRRADDDTSVRDAGDAKAPFTAEKADRWELG